MTHLNWRWYILISFCLLPFLCSASRTQPHRQCQANRTFSLSKKARTGNLGYLDHLKLCFINQDVNCSKQLLDRALYILIKAIPFIRNSDQLNQLTECFRDISAAALDHQDEVSGRSALMNCCVFGSYSAANMLVQRNVSVNTRDAAGNTALMLLATNGLPWYSSSEGIGLFRSLLARSELTVRNRVSQCFLDMHTLSPSDYLLAFNSALNRDDVRSVDKLLSLPEADCLSFAFVPLIRTQLMAQVVYKHSGDKVLPHVTSLHPLTGLTILHSAVMAKNCKFVKYLLDIYKCPIDTKERSRGLTPVSLALYLLPKVAENADIEALNDIVYRLFEDAGDMISEIYREDPIEELMKDAGEALWEGPRDLYAKLVNWEAWMIEKMRQVFAKYPAVKRELLKLGFNVEFSRGISLAHMNVVLKRAIAANSLQCIGFLLHYDAPTTGIIEHITTRDQVELVIKYIGEDAYQALLDERDQNGFTKFHHAVINADYSLVQRYLMELHANPNLQDLLGRSCLMIALDCTRSRDPNTYDMIIQLLVPYSDADIKDATGRSPSDLLDKRPIYKKLHTNTVFMIIEQQNRRALVARELAFYQSLKN